VEELRAAMDPAAVERFLLRAGGMRLYVPHAPRTGSPLMALGAGESHLKTRAGGLV
jgi:hypothetical protein